MHEIGHIEIKAYKINHFIYLFIYVRQDEIGADLPLHFEWLKASSWVLLVGKVSLISSDSLTLRVEVSWLSLEVLLELLLNA